MEQVLNNAMQTISQYVKNNTATFPQQIICRRANESDCELTRLNNNYTVTVHNGNSRLLNTLIRVPLYQNTYNVSLTDSEGNPVDYQIINVFGNPSQLNNSNMAPLEIYFMATIQALEKKSKKDRLLMIVVIMD
uniref:Uncharacterized protein n=1 Tax=Acrobeloides nanus TaxID=290746 RepID=A0A914EQY4_9BILA